MGRRFHAVTANTFVDQTGPGATTPPRILIVEDDGAFASSLVRFVESLGCEATVAATVRSAMDHLVDADAWAALTLDVSLVDGSGIDVLSRARVAHSRVPALLLTGLVDREIANAAFRLRAEYLVKPVTPPQLKDFLERALAARTSPPPPMIHDLPDELQRLARDVRLAAAAEGVAHTEYAFRVALLAGAMRRHQQQGPRLLELCAQAVNMSRSTFQEYAAVTTRWNAAEIRLLLSRRDSLGHRVTISHLLMIVRAHRALRPQLEQILHDCADIRLLSHLRSRR